MFGLFKRGSAQPIPEEPIEMKATIEIGRSAADVYALLDFADDRHQLRARGNLIREVERDPLTYRLWYDLAPDHNFLFTVTDAVPDRFYAYEASIVPQIGLRSGSHEAWTIEPLGAEECKVTFVNTIHHVPGLTRAQLGDEIAKSSHAAANALTKLRIHAEIGAEAVEAFERDMRQR